MSRDLPIKDEYLLRYVTFYNSSLKELVLQVKLVIRLKKGCSDAAVFTLQLRLQIRVLILAVSLG